MKLYLSGTSPYARIVRMALLEKHLDDRVEHIVHETRIPGSPVHAVNPTARVPSLALDDGVVLSESRLICEHLDAVAPEPRFVAEVGDLAGRALEGITTGFLDGVAVWSRELNHRVVEERSPKVLKHEAERAERCLAYFDARAGELAIEVRYAQAALFIALTALVDRCALDWPRAYPNLARWYESMRAAESVSRSASVPPAR